MPRDDRPEYLRIADELRARISEGAYRPGDKLPTLPELHDSYGVFETTIRNALAVLRNEGLIESRTRAGTTVREQPPIHRMAADRYQPVPGGELPPLLGRC